MPLVLFLISCKSFINASATRSGAFLFTPGQVQVGGLGRKSYKWLQGKSCFIMFNSFVLDQRSRDNSSHRVDTRSMFSLSLSGKISKMRKSTSSGRSSTVIEGAKMDSPSALTAFPISNCLCSWMLSSSGTDSYCLLSSFDCSFFDLLIIAFDTNSVPNKIKRQ